MKFKEEDFEENICWECIHSVPNLCDRGCPWSMFFEPVDGWDATPTADGGYLIKGCPMFREMADRMVDKEDDAYVSDETVQD